MDIKEYVIRYGVVAGRRFYPPEKLRFIMGLLKELDQMKIPVDVKEGKKAQRKAYNLYAGDLEESPFILSAYYDTPPKSFGFIRHKVFDAKNDSYGYKISVLIAMALIAITGALLIQYVFKPVWTDGIFDFRDVLYILPTLILVYLLFKYRNGIGNANNLIRNTSGVIAALVFAEKLGLKEKKKIAFAFTDFGCINRFGDYMLRDSLKEKIDHKTIILLDSIGAEEGLSVLYSKSAKEHIEKLKASKTYENVYFQPITDENNTYARIYKNYMVITSGRPFQESIYINKANTLKDNDINEENINLTVDILNELIS